MNRLWNIAKNKECLWIHNYFIRGQNIERVQIPKNASWVVRKNLASRDWILQGQARQGALISAFDACQKGHKFSTHQMYTNLLPQYPKDDWRVKTLHPSIHPRFKFFISLAIQERLATADRLLKFGIQAPTDCAYCGLTMETFSHLFFECQVTKAL